MSLDRDALVKVKSSQYARTWTPWTRGSYRCEYIGLFRGFRFSSSCSTAYETGGLGRGIEGSRLSKRIPRKSYTKGQSRRATIQRSQSNLRCAARERFGPTTVSSIRK